MPLTPTWLQWPPLDAPGIGYASGLITNCTMTNKVVSQADGRRVMRRIVGASPMTGNAGICLVGRQAASGTVVALVRFASVSLR